MTNENGKSDNPIVPEKLPNKAHRAAEVMEERGLAKGNRSEQNTLRTQSRAGVQSALGRIRQAAQRDGKQRFTALYHHVYQLDMLRESYYALKHTATPGIDGVTWRCYGEKLEENLAVLSIRLKRGAYRALPSSRTHIPKPDGRKRPIGVSALEDKIVQRAAAAVLNAVYECDFIGFSYGLRPRRCPHDALDALYAGIMKRRVNWVLDADIREFFDTLGHEWIGRFVRHRIADKRIRRLIQKWLKTGVLEDGALMQADRGTVQGGSISPVLANIYLHYVLDLWAQQWRNRHARGDMIIVRFADDFVVGFQYRNEAEQFLAELKERFARFCLALHDDKTRLIAFGRSAMRYRSSHGEGKPEVFNFLGFTHICGRTRKGWFTIRRKTNGKKLRSKLGEVKAQLRIRLHDPVPEQGAYLRAVVAGHTRYYGVPFNSPSINVFRKEVCKLWTRTLRRRSHKHRVTWDRMRRLIAKWIPPARICHPHPLKRFGVITQGRSPVR